MEKACSSLKAGISLLFLFICLSLILYLVYSGYEEVVLEVEILSFSAISMSFPVVFDWSGVFFSSAVLLISGCVMVFSSFYMDHESFHSRFVGLVMLFVLSMNFLIYVPSLFGLMIGWDGLGVISFLLVIYYQNKSSLGAGMITVLTNRIGDVLFIMGIGVLSGTMSWLFLDLSDFVLPLLIVGFVVVGSMTKSAQIPFSAWLPAAMAAPTPVSALVHSSTLVTAGVYVLVRFSSSMSENWGVFLMTMSVLTLLMAGLSASFECDLKKVIALSTLSQLGMMMLTISVGMVDLCVFHLVTHALFKALMFMCAGGIIHLSGGVQDSRCFSGLWFKLPIINSWLVVSCLSLMGAPFMAGFYSKDLILEWCLGGFSSALMVLLISLGTFLTAFYSVRFLYLSMSGGEFFSLVNFSSLNMSLVFSSSVLGAGAIFGGFLIQEFILEMNVFVGIMMFWKMSIPFSVGLGIFLSLKLFSSVSKVLKDFSVFLTLKSVLDFNSKMWFLPFLSGSFFGGSFLSISSKALVCFDLGWVEGLGGGKGISNSAGNLSLMNSKLQSGLLGIYFCVGFIFFYFWVLILNS